MRRTRPLGPSNDEGVPEDEILLAKLIQNAAARGYHSIQGLSYDGTGCCATGSAALESDTRSRLMSGATAMTTGNDVPDGHDWYSRTSSLRTESYLSNFTVGAAFEQALRPAPGRGRS